MVARAAELGLTAYAIALRTDGRASEDAVKDYLTGRSSLGSERLHHVLRVLGLRITAESV